MLENDTLRCPNCGTVYDTDEALRALLENEGYCVSPTCRCDLASVFQDDDVWFDFFGDGEIDGDMDPNDPT